MSILKVPGAQLYYEVSGSGPLLILIPGASGTGESFRPLVCELITRYQVVTYDRRGFSRSSLDGLQDYEHRLATHADDVRRLIEHLPDQPAIVFGNSSGAIVALQVLIQSPWLVKKVVAHEPPLVSLLPNTAQWQTSGNSVYETYRKEGVLKAMRQFASGMAEEDRLVIERAMTEQANAYTEANAV